MSARAVASAWRTLALPVATLALATALLLAAGCASRPRAVVVERSLDTRPPPPVQAPTASEYVVVRGDTLYAIAFRHGLDVHALARLNGIGSPYTIYPGQRLRLSGQAAPPRGAIAARPNAPPTPPRGGLTAPDAPTASGRPVLAGPTAPAGGAAKAPAKPPAAKPPAAKPPAPKPPAAGGAIIWRWPTEGQLLTGFSAGDPTRQGIDIVGRAGQPVVAAADGEVVYSGTGLVGYGELVIVKHSSQWLSAYGHNRKRLVAEGQKVKAGQQIAEMGRSGASRDMLHFEIRRNGKPVDPLALLPRR